MVTSNGLQIGAPDAISQIAIPYSLSHGVVSFGLVAASLAAVLWLARVVVDAGECEQWLIEHAERPQKRQEAAESRVPLHHTLNMSLVCQLPQAIHGSRHPS
ncbi:hypothetical protein BDW22DRAFT_1054872 [Trametopsis cervina]|nr:hypothetical protein BDW22DRAFT_1054872 [Trametopsis cervina]